MTLFFKILFVFFLLCFRHSPAQTPIRTLDDFASYSILREQTPPEALQSPLPKPLPFCVVTIAKSGSHLLLQAIDKITRKTHSWISSGYPEKIETLPAHQYPWTHFCLSPELLRKFETRRMILMIRDLRDICISVTHTLRENISTQSNPPRIYHPDFLSLSFEEQLLEVITENTQMHPKDPFLDWTFSQSFPQAAILAIRPNVLVCHYEDLVGPQGGGTIERQRATLQAIANFLQIPLPPERVESIAQNLYGNSWTYRRGSIGSWKNAFTEAHKQAFLERFGHILIDLDYEKDFFW